MDAWPCRRRPPPSTRDRWFYLESNQCHSLIPSDNAHRAILQWWRVEVTCIIPSELYVYTLHHPPSVSIPTSHKHNSSILIGIQRINYQTKALMSPCLNNPPFYRVAQFILGGETIQCIYYPLYNLRRSKFMSPLISWLVVVFGRRIVSHWKAESMENTIYPLNQLVSLSLDHHWMPRITHSLQIHPILCISACSSSRKAMSGDLESPWVALSIGCSFEA
jgi:hypothetical protein